MTFSDDAPLHFRNDLHLLTEHLSPYMVTVKGFDLLGPDTPPDLARPYRSLCQMGWANGWLKVGES